MNKRVVAVVLAAGKAERMGRLKQLLPFGQKTVLETVVDTLLATSVAEILVVLGHRAEDVQAVLSGRNVSSTVNPNYEKGMFSSVLCGLDTLPQDADGMMMLLGDQPQIRASVVNAVLDRFQVTDKGIVIPEVQGHRGHPVIIDIHRYGPAIRSLDGAEGLKPVVRGFPDDTEIVRLDDESILRDMDTPEDYERELRLREIDDKRDEWLRK
jgi:molybdenum cofactor cytidylyltransferase